MTSWTENTLTSEQRKRFDAAAERGLATRREIREAITPVVVAVNRYVENQAECDEAARLGLWRAMTAAVDAAAEAYGVYPLSSEWKVDSR